jgi:hypothetical protein
LNEDSCAATASAAQMCCTDVSICGAAKAASMSVAQPSRSEGCVGILRRVCVRTSAGRRVGRVTTASRSRRAAPVRRARASRTQRPRSWRPCECIATAPRVAAPGGCLSAADCRQHIEIGNAGTGLDRYVLSRWIRCVGHQRSEPYATANRYRAGRAFA